jgi:hypothetical protein
VLKHYTDEQLGCDFRLAELGQLRRLGSSVELVALREAYSDHLAMLTGRAESFATAAGVAPLPKGEVRARVLGELVAAAETLVGPAKAGRPVLPESLVQLELLGRLVEPRFVAVTPVVGPLIVRLRQLWNWMSTRWYVGPVLEQQSEFNRATVEALRQLDTTVRTLQAHRPTGAQSDGLSGPRAQLRRVEDRPDTMAEGLGAVMELDRSDQQVDVERIMAGLRARIRARGGADDPDDVSVDTDDAAGGVLDPRVSSNLHQATLLTRPAQVEYPLGWRTPLIGPVWTAVRRLIHQEIRIYLDVMTRQQAAYNTHVLKALAGMVRAFGVVAPRSEVNALRAETTEVAHLRAEVAALRGEVEELRRQLDQRGIGRQCG